MVMGTATARRVFPSYPQLAFQMLDYMLQCDKIIRKEKEDSW